MKILSLKLDDNIFEEAEESYKTRKNSSGCNCSARPVK
jgi:hypothetical protein